MNPPDTPRKGAALLAKVTDAITGVLIRLLPDAQTASRPEGKKAPHLRP